MFITTACFFSLQNTQVHKSYENKTVFIHTAALKYNRMFRFCAGKKVAVKFTTTFPIV